MEKIQKWNSKNMNLTFGMCNVCKEWTHNSCKNCSVIYYCSRNHAKQNLPVHKSRCKKVQKILVNIDKKIIPLDKFCKTIAEMFSSNMVPVLVASSNLWNQDEEIKKDFAFLDIKEIREQEGKRYFLMKESPVPLEESKEINLKNGISENDFWAMYHVGKSVYFNMAVLIALAELQSRKIKFVLDKKSKEPIESFESVTVKVIKPWVPIIPTFSWDEKSFHDCNFSNLNQHRVISAKGLQRFYIDFTSAQFGIPSNQESKMPYVFCGEKEMATLYEENEKKDIDSILKILQLALQEDIVLKDPKMKVLFTIKNLIVQAGLFLNFDD